MLILNRSVILSILLVILSGINEQTYGPGFAYTVLMQARFAFHVLLIMELAPSIYWLLEM
jgi:hypothetical protein